MRSAHVVLLTRRAQPLEPELTDGLEHAEPSRHADGVDHADETLLHECLH
jgi:hypothetical protein